MALDHVNIVLITRERERERERDLTVYFIPVVRGQVRRYPALTSPPSRPAVSRLEDGLGQLTAAH